MNRVDRNIGGVGYKEKLANTRWKAFDAICGKQRERKVTRAMQQRVVYIVLGCFFLVQFGIREDSTI